MKKRPSDILNRELGIPQTYRIQIKSIEAIELILAARLAEWEKTKIGYKPSLNDIQNEVIKRGIESVMMTDYPIQGWRREIYKTVNLSKREYEVLVGKKREMDEKAKIPVLPKPKPKPKVHRPRRNPVDFLDEF